MTGTRLGGHRAADTLHCPKRPCEDERDMKMRPWFPSDSGSTVSPVRRARSKRSDPGCPTSEAGVSVREGCRGSDGPRDGRAAAQLHRGGRGPGTGAVTVCARRPAAVRPAARRPRRSSGTARPRADASPLGPEPSPVEGTSLRAPPSLWLPTYPRRGRGRSWPASGKSRC